MRRSAPSLQVNRRGRCGSASRVRGVPSAFLSCSRPASCRCVVGAKPAVSPHSALHAQPHAAAPGPGVPGPVAASVSAGIPMGVALGPWARAGGRGPLREKAASTCAARAPFKLSPSRSVLGRRRGWCFLTVRAGVWAPGGQACAPEPAALGVAAVQTPPSHFRERGQVRCRPRERVFVEHFAGSDKPLGRRKCRLKTCVEPPAPPSCSVSVHVQRIGGALAAQSAAHLALDRGSGLDRRVVRSRSPRLRPLHSRAEPQGVGRKHTSRPPCERVPAVRRGRRSCRRPFARQQLEAGPRQPPSVVNTEA